jgi:hypothetical protein
MDGMDYRALVEITDAAGVVLAQPGETCERIAEPALIWLVAGGYIEPVEGD